MLYLCFIYEMGVYLSFYFKFNILQKILQDDLCK
jgi:hypothetical protein